LVIRKTQRELTGHALSLFHHDRLKENEKAELL
jgi:hypothetical protein